MCASPLAGLLTREQRRVWFADGLLPNGDATESAKSPNPVPEPGLRSMAGSLFPTKSPPSDASEVRPRSPHHHHHHHLRGTLTGSYFIDPPREHKGATSGWFTGRYNDAFCLRVAAFWVKASATEVHGYEEMS